MPIFCVKSVKIYTDAVSGVSDKYQVCDSDGHDCKLNRGRTLAYLDSGGLSGELAEAGISPFKELAMHFQREIPWAF